MDIIKCPKCGKDFQVDISKAKDEFGEVFKCLNCNYIFIYAIK
jgi:predicted RNA-binding Zn-ribbon protein involved in translation (DUF1610 family)